MDIAGPIAEPGREQLDTLVTLHRAHRLRSWLFHDKGDDRTLGPF